MQRMNDTLVLTLLLLGALASSATAQVPSKAKSSMPTEIIRLTNHERQRAGLAPLHHNSVLTSAAVGHATAMAKAEQMSHTLHGSTLGTRIARVGYEYSTCGENVGFGYTTSPEVVSAWMSSSGHRANILCPEYTQIGVAVRYSRSGTAYYCQVFGAPR